MERSLHVVGADRQCTPSHQPCNCSVWLLSSRPGNYLQLYFVKTCPFSVPFRHVCTHTDTDRELHFISSFLDGRTMRHKARWILKVTLFTVLWVIKVGRLCLFHGADKPQTAMTPAGLVLGLQTKVLQISWVLRDGMLQNAGQQPACPGMPKVHGKTCSGFPISCTS